jgi:transmembrane sensor
MAMKNTSIPNSEYWYETISAYKQGELSKQQEQELFRWKTEKPEHAAFFEETEIAWTASRESIQFPEFDASKAWAKVKAQTIDVSSVKEIPLLTYVFRMPLTRAAAAVLVLITISWAMSNVLFTKPTFTNLQAFDGMKEFYLPDSSKVYLHDTTTIRYSSTYGEDERMVFLDGEAFFEVRKDASKPFTVLSYRSRVIVKGTSFMVRSRATDSLDVVEVVEGKVAVLEKYSRSGKELMLTKGMTCSVDVYGGLHQKTELVTNTAPWRNKEILIFMGTPLKQVLQDLNKHLGITVVLKDVKSENCRFTGEFENSNPEEILEIIALTMNMQLQKEGVNFALIGNGCK